MSHHEALSGQSIDTIESLDIGGVSQWISLRSEDVSNPLILFLHGGPGTAQIGFSRRAQKALESEFLVVNWDQRGAGRSFARSSRRDDMRIERFVSDGEELAETLLRRFGQARLILVGQSWGSVVGTHLAVRRPDLLTSYVGVGQVVDMQRGEALSYQFARSEAIRLMDARAVRRLDKIGPPPYTNLRSAGVQRRLLSRYHGVTYEGSVVGTILKNLSVKDIRPLDVIRFVAGAIFSLSSLEEEQMKVDLGRDVAELKMPVYFCVGRRDFTTPSELVVDYVDRLRAPHKEIVWFEHSAHLPNFEEPERFCEFCKSRLKPPT